MDQLDALKQKGNAAFQSNDFSTAVAAFGEAIEFASQGGLDAAPLHSNRSVALLRLAELQAANTDGFAKQTYRRAIDDANKVIELKPTWNKGHFRKAEVYFSQRDFKEAEACYKKALELMPGDEHVKERLAQTQQALTGFIFKQILSGREVAVRPNNVTDQQVFAFASQMANFMYVIGDVASGECLVVDACWDVPGILRFIKGLNLKLVGAIVTHYHFDHTGGKPPPPFDVTGITVSGIKDLADAGLPVYVHKEDAAELEKSNGVPQSAMRVVEHNSVIRLGRLEMKVLHTPGHTPGSMCVYLDGSSERGTADGVGLLVAGDTLFKGSCGRLDLPDCNTDHMYNSLQNTLGKLAEHTKVYPGHNYGGDVTTIGAEKRAGLLRPMTPIQWRQMHRL